MPSRSQAAACAAAVVLVALPLQSQNRRWSPSFGADTGWRQELHPRTMADVDGDGAADVVGFAYAGVMVAFSDGAEFEPAQLVIAGSFGYGDGWRTDRHLRRLADVDGDGRADIVGFGDGRVWVARSLGRRFAAPEVWTNQFTIAGGWTVEDHPRLLADFDEDGDADIIAFASSGLMVARSTGTRFEPGVFQHAEFGLAQGWSGATDLRVAADVNGDEHADVVGFGPIDTRVSLGGPTGFGAPQIWSAAFSRRDDWGEARYVRRVVDVDGDGLADVVGFGEAGTWIARSDGRRFGTPAFQRVFAGRDGWREGQPRTAVDLDGDGRADAIGFREDGTWVSFAGPGGSFEPAVHLACSMGTSPCYPGAAELRFVVDVDGDGTRDLVAFQGDGVYADVSPMGCRRSLSVDRCHQSWWAEPHPAGYLISGTTARFALDAGPAAAGQPFFLLGSLSGRSPGLTLFGGDVLPLNDDRFLQWALTSPTVGSAYGRLTGSVGVLDAGGRAAATYEPGSLFVFLGHSAPVEIDFAYARYDAARNRWVASDWAHVTYWRR